MQFLEYCTKIAVLHGVAKSQTLLSDWTELNSTKSGASQVALMVKSWPANAGNVTDLGSIPGSGRCPGGGHGRPLQYSCLENFMDRGAQWASVHRVAKSQTWLQWLGTHTLKVKNRVIVWVQNECKWAACLLSWSQGGQELSSLLLPRITREYYTTSC